MTLNEPAVTALLKDSPTETDLLINAQMIEFVPGADAQHRLTEVFTKRRDELRGKATK
jgi:hypothetical protein